MNVIQLFVIALGLSADAFAVSVTNGLCYRKPKYILLSAAAFGIFQGVMPGLGYLLGLSFIGFVEKIDHIVALVILAAIGGKALYDGIKERRGGAEPGGGEPTLKLILAQAVATSIDALVVGVSFIALSSEAGAVFAYSGVIAAVTFAVCLAGGYIGKTAASRSPLGAFAKILGGVILIGIGVKVFAEHVFNL